MNAALMRRLWRVAVERHVGSLTDKKSKLLTVAFNYFNLKFPFSGIS